MNLTEKFKEKISKAKSKDEIKDIFEDAGLILSDDELNEISGGVRIYKIPNLQIDEVNVPSDSPWPKW